MQSKTIELLAPAGNWVSFLAAMGNGADAVYLGGENFSARQNADNFTMEQIKQAVRYAHLRRKKIYAAVNILIADSEFDKVLAYIGNLYHLGVDAIIVQDMGLLRAVKDLWPEFKIHASTQMTAADENAVKLLAEAGVDRVVLARELSREELNILCTPKSAELEIFVHGALCFSYSGQCLFSSMVGGRSGNRGRCAQPCRLPYTLYCADESSILKTPGLHLLSPADLFLLEQIPYVMDWGVDSLKIEGRMKRPEYVAIVTRAYREAIDAVSQKQDIDAGLLKEKLLKVFNRNFSTGYWFGYNAQWLSPQRPNNRGVYAGRVLAQTPDYVTTVKLTDSLVLGDGLEFWVSRGKGSGLTVREIKRGAEFVTKAQSGDIVQLRLSWPTAPNDRVFKTHDYELLSQATTGINDKQNRIELDAEVYLAAGEPMRLVLSDDNGNRVQTFSSNVAEPALNRALDEITLREKIGRLGDTAFKLRRFQLYMEEPLIVAFSEINKMRRQAVTELENIYLKNDTRKINKLDNTSDINYRFLPDNSGIKPEQMRLSVMVNNVASGESALQAGADLVYVGLEGVGSSNRVSAKDLFVLKCLAQNVGSRLIPALPRIKTSGDDRYYRLLQQMEASVVLAGNWGDIWWCKEQGLLFRVDYSLNVFNNFSAQYFHALGAEGITLSPELNSAQLAGFEPCCGYGLEMVVHGELVLMVSRHCVLRDILSSGSGSCNKTCRRHSFQLRDQKGYVFPLGTDHDCRFYVFNSRTLCLLEELPLINSWGIKMVRLDLRNSKEASISKTVKVYREAVTALNRGNGFDAHSEKQKLEKDQLFAFTKGHFYRGVL